MNDESNQAINTKGRSYGCMVTIVTMLIIIVAVVLCLYFFGRKDATNDDVTINEGQDNLLSYTFTFIPNNDIDNLEFEVSFYDSNRKHLSDITKKVGNVKKGKQYSVTINLTELSLKQVFSDYVSINVSGGTTHIISF